MDKRLLAELAFLAVVIFTLGYVCGDSLIKPNVAANLNVTAPTEVFTSVSQIITALSGSILGIAGIIALLQKLLQDRRWKRKYGESRTPVVIQARET